MAINFFSEDIAFRITVKKKIKNWIQTVIENYKYKVGDVSYIFTSEQRILEINNQYLGHNYFTDIITFPYSEGNKISADIFISIPTVKSNALKFSNSFEHELNRVMVHGVLHLVGFNDHTNEEIIEMRKAEDFWINELSIN